MQWQLWFYIQVIHLPTSSFPSLAFCKRVSEWHYSQRKSEEHTTPWSIFSLPNLGCTCTHMQTDTELTRTCTSLRLPAPYQDADTQWTWDPDWRQSIAMAPGAKMTGICSNWATSRLFITPSANSAASLSSQAAVAALPAGVCPSLCAE